MKLLLASVGFLILSSVHWSTLSIEDVSYSLSRAYRGALTKLSGSDELPTQNKEKVSEKSLQDRDEEGRIRFEVAVKHTD